MSEQAGFTFESFVEDAKRKAKDGGAILAALDPELPWEKMDNLVGESILILSIEPGRSDYADEAIRLTFIKEDDSAWRVTVIQEVLLHALMKLKEYLPVWVKIIKTESRSGRSYYEIEKGEGESTPVQEDIPF